MAAVGTKALAQRANEVGIAPRADATDRVGADVGAEESTERGSDRNTAPQRRAVMGLVGMAAAATGQREQIGTPFRGTAGCPRRFGPGDERHQKGEKNRSRD